MIANNLGALIIGDLNFRLTAYDGSAVGDPDAEFGLHIANERGLRYILTAPGDLGLARAYTTGDLRLIGADPGDPFNALMAVKGSSSGLKFRTPSPGEAARLLRTVGIDKLRPPPIPAQEHAPRWRRLVDGVLHSQGRDAEAIRHHYDVSNRFYELVLGPSMTYTCAVFPNDESTLEEAQFEKYDLIARKLALKPGQRLLDVGCGWGGMVRHAVTHYGVRALGVTLSREQSAWAQQRIIAEGLEDLAEVCFGDYRDVSTDGYDAVCSIGLTEHIGVANYPAYFAFLRSKLRPQGRLLNHCITRSHNRNEGTGAFIDRYIFPDGELTGSGRIVAAAQDAGLEVHHTENLRMHYAHTLAAWNRNLQENWDECVAEVGEATARVWGLYIAGSRMGFVTDEIELHHVLATRNDDDHVSGMPLRGW